MELFTLAMSFGSYDPQTYSLSYKRHFLKSYRRRNTICNLTKPLTKMKRKQIAKNLKFFENQARKTFFFMTLTACSTLRKEV